MNDIIYSMTDEVAFELGKFDFPCFYEHALWRVNIDPFPLYHFFKWKMGWGIPVSGGEESKVLWDEIKLEGMLDLTKFTDISHKLAYVRGRLNSYSVSSTETTLSVGWANSYRIRDFFVECLEDSLKVNFGLATKWTIEKGEGKCTIPGTPYAKLTADKHVIDFILER